MSTIPAGGKKWDGVACGPIVPTEDIPVPYGGGPDFVAWTRSLGEALTAAIAGAALALGDLKLDAPRVDHLSLVRDLEAPLVDLNFTAPPCPQAPGGYRFGLRYARSADARAFGAQPRVICAVPGGVVERLSELFARREDGTAPAAVEPAPVRQMA